MAHGGNPRSARRLAAFFGAGAATLILAACAGTTAAPVGAHHPADPSAAAAARPGHDPAMGRHDMPTMTHDKSAMDHDMPSMDHDMSSMGAMDHDAMTAAPEGGDGHNHAHADALGDQVARLPDGQDQEAAVDRVIEVAAVDVGFEPKSVRVRHGETVRFVVTNKGAIDHEFVIGDRAAQVAHAAEMAAMGPGMDHSHVTNAISLEPGETKEITWTVASHDLQFACHVPGHYDAGMWGTIDLAE